MVENTSSPKGSLVIGVHPVMEALKAKKEVDTVLVQNGLRSEGIQQIITLCKQQNVPVKFVPADKLNRLKKGVHQGVAAFLASIEYVPLEEVISRAFEAGQDPLVLVLDRITDTRNLGAIARTAESVGVHAIVVPEAGSAMITAETVKASAGAILNLPVCKVKNLTDALLSLKSSGLLLAAVSEKATKTYTKENFHGPIALLLGSEEDGISKHLLKLADLHIRIPMLGKTSSLNVSVAAAVLLYEVIRQRGL